jgi:Heparinase II/III-like protein
LHFDLWDGPRNLLRDGGSGAYNPPPGCAWWLDALQGAAGHNGISFDGQEPMLRLSRFLYAHWPACGPLAGRQWADGGWMRDWRGNRQERRVSVRGRCWQVEDRVAGPFRHLSLRWRLAPGEWRLTATGAEGPWARLTIAADAPILLRLEQGWESLAYGQVSPLPVLVARAAAPVSRLTTIVALP